MKYINYKSPYTKETETLEECNNIKEAKQLLKEYNQAFKGGCYISQRCCNNWK